MVRATLVFTALLAPFVLAAPTANSRAVVRLRIEGDAHTILDTLIVTRGHDVETDLGGRHHCDGTNLQANPSPGATATSALDDASKRKHFVWDGKFFPEFDDYLVSNIAGHLGTDTKFWRLLVNHKTSDVGGCQKQVKTGDEVLFALAAFDDTPLELSGPTFARAGHPVTFTVVDGETGTPIAGASVGGLVSDANGHVTVTFYDAGPRTLTAEKANAIRSNALQFIVG